MHGMTRVLDVLLLVCFSLLECSILSNFFPCTAYIVGNDKIKLIEQCIFLNMLESTFVCIS